MTEQPKDIKPLLPESSTAESTYVEIALRELEEGILKIPDYQRDSDQWDTTTKSLLVESVINNLSIPAFFFEVAFEDMEGGVIEVNYVIDGQQRLTTLASFYNGEFAMSASDEASYLSSRSAHYAGKYFRELPRPYQQAFNKYRLAVIKLRNISEMRLEVFRRINQGGTPLSGQDIRLTYYGEKSPSLAFIRLVGVFDLDTAGSKRFLSHAEKEFNIQYPWIDPAKGCWEDWWKDKALAKGQKASEAFLWSVVAAQYDKMHDLLKNEGALRTLNCRFNNSMDGALDVCCAQLRYQDQNEHKQEVPVLMTYDEMSNHFFPYFQKWVAAILGSKAVNTPVTKHRGLSAVIGTAYSLSCDVSTLNRQQWTDIAEFIRQPSKVASQLGVNYPQSKGRWEGGKGYKEQFVAVKGIVRKIIQ